MTVSVYTLLAGEEVGVTEGVREGEGVGDEGPMAGAVPVVDGEGEGEGEGDPA